MKANDILHYLLNDGVTLDFLKETSYGISSEILAEIVTELKKIGKTPKGLNEFLQKNKFPIYDIVGTGGTGGARLNTSTLVTLFTPQFGLMAIKHGGRSSSGKIGSNDFTESLGISLNNMFQYAAEYLRATGILFLAAAYTYPIFAKCAPLRKQLTSPTIFNLLGPLLNPIQVYGKIIGAYNLDTAVIIANTCLLLKENAIVVTAQDKKDFLDEASPFGRTTLYICNRNSISKVVIEAVEELSKPLTIIFSDSRKVTNDLLSLKQTEETLVAKKLISYNLALLCYMHNLNSKGSPFLKNEFIKLYELIFSNFDYHLQCVNSTIFNIANFQPVHERSPIHAL